MSNNLDQNSLKGIHVLLDGYNIQLPQGTGIKTYALSLASTLESLDAEVSILSSIPIKPSKNKLLEAVLFGETQEGSYSKRSIYWMMLNQLANFGLKVNKIAQKDYVIFSPSESWISKYNVYNFPHCFEFSNLIYKKLSYISSYSVSSKINIFHATYPLPIRFKRAKKITTIHDLIPLRLPYTTLDRKKFFFENIRQSIATSDLIFSVSESTKKDILEAFDINPNKVIVTYQPLLLEPLSEDESQLLRNGLYHTSLGLKYKGYILFVGTIEPKKNVERLIEAYATIDTNMPLVIAGKKGWLWEKQLAKLDRLPSHKRSKVVLLDYVSKLDLRYLFAGAYCFVFPSLYEGFGVPVLEAMSFGCPVITSNTSSLPEVGGNAAIYVNPYDSLDIANAITKLIGSPSLCEVMKNNGYQQINKFNQSTYKQKVLNAYTKVL